MVYCRAGESKIRRFRERPLVCPTNATNRFLTPFVMVTAGVRSWTIFERMAYTGFFTYMIKTKVNLWLVASAVIATCILGLSTFEVTLWCLFPSD